MVHEIYLQQKYQEIFSHKHSYSIFSSNSNVSKLKSITPVDSLNFGFLIKLDQSKISAGKSWSPYDKDFLQLHSNKMQAHVNRLYDDELVSGIKKIFKEDSSKAFDNLNPILNHKIIKQLPNIDNYSIVGLRFQDKVEAFYLVRNDILDPSLKCY